MSETPARTIESEHIDLSDPTGDTGTTRKWRPGGLELLIALMAVALLLSSQLTKLFSVPSLQAGATIFVSITIQALPFLVLGVVLSGIITAYVPVAFWGKVLPRNRALAVPVAGAAGAVLPGCECASVPVAGGLMARGVAPPAALAFLLSAPAINPIVIVSTLVAFPGQPQMAVGRFFASLAASMIMGWLWLWKGRKEWIRIPDRSHLVGGNKWHTFRLTTAHDFLHAGGFLIVGAVASAVLNVAVPREWLDAVGSNPFWSVLAMAILAVVLCICSEADAFVAASLTQFSLTSRLVFLVVGPMVDLKLIALQTGTFGREFAIRFAPVSFVVATTCAVVAGSVLL